MEVNLKDLVVAHGQFICEAQEFSGTIWKEFYSELHSQFKEVPVWILLYEDSNLDEVYVKFKFIAESYIHRFPGFNFTVSFEVYRENRLLHIDFLTDNEEIQRGWSLKPPLGSTPSFTRKKSGLFQSKDSRRKG